MLPWCFLIAPTVMFDYFAYRSAAGEARGYGRSDAHGRRTRFNSALALGLGRGAVRSARVALWSAAIMSESYAGEVVNVRSLHADRR